jgi:hypothetical protein
MATGNPRNVRVDPGWLYVAPLASLEPTSFEGDWDEAWTQIGYTDQGPEFVMEQTFERLRVAEEIDPISTFQTERNTMVNFAMAEVTATNLQRALNGGTITTPAGIVQFEPPPAGDVTYLMLGWDSTDGLERWVFRKAVSTGNITIPRRRSPDKAVIPVSFEIVKPDLDEHDEAVAPWIMWHAENYEEPGS